MKPKRKNRAAVALAKRGSKMMTPQQRSERARLAVMARWAKHKDRLEKTNEERATNEEPK